MVHFFVQVAIRCQSIGIVLAHQLHDEFERMRVEWLAARNVDVAVGCARRIAGLTHERDRGSTYAVPGLRRRHPPCV